MRSAETVRAALACGGHHDDAAESAGNMGCPVDGLGQAEIEVHGVYSAARWGLIRVGTLPKYDQAKRMVLRR